jgi:hypothetical protein
VANSTSISLSSNGSVTGREVLLGHLGLLDRDRAELVVEVGLLHDVLARDLLALGDADGDVHQVVRNLAGLDEVPEGREARSPPRQPDGSVTV